MSYEANPKAGVGCRHLHTGIFSYVDWCYECGAIRMLKPAKGNAYTYAWSGWLYPRGDKEVLKRLEKVSPSYRKAVNG